MPLSKFEKKQISPSPAVITVAHPRFLVLCMFAARLFLARFAAPPELYLHLSLHGAVQPLHDPLQGLEACAEFLVLDTHVEMFQEEVDADIADGLAR
ncbi:hypothetical protein PVAR5_2048 [Paecilomyces variotii No. 5]|uniref:Uncharacterized protein n=1 Tax=Byssochlamys spectabilis (strain No. 5 / NBRC 109023) TaxID=1356009 RepID=V5FNE6_BYSSN|nr:hypothetical protein PVAR5_2048 [Paecilomyces variotii No. 5]